jgi:hypothetical protein
MGGAIVGSPDASKVALEPGRLDVVVRGTDNQLQYRRFDGAVWGGPVTVPGALTADPTVATWNREPVAVNFVGVSGGALRHRTAT